MYASGRESSSALRRAVYCKDYIYLEIVLKTFVFPALAWRTFDWLDPPKRFPKYKNAVSTSACGTLDPSMLDGLLSSSPRPRLQEHLVAFSRKRHAIDAPHNFILYFSYSYLIEKMEGYVICSLFRDDSYSLSALVASTAGNGLWALVYLYFPRLLNMALVLPWRSW